MIELGRPSRIGIMKFITGEGSFSTEKDFKDDVLDKDGEAIDFRLPQGAVGFLIQFRNSSTATFRYSFLKGEVIEATNGIFWTSKANIPEGETGINVDSNGPEDKLNVYVAASAAGTILEVRVWHGYS